MLIKWIVRGEAATLSLTVLIVQTDKHHALPHCAVNTVIVQMYYRTVICTPPQ